jgi:hypothetical protein
MVAIGYGFTRTVKALPQGSDLTPKVLREHIARGHSASLQAVAKRLVDRAGGDPARVLEQGVEAAVLRLADAVGVVAAADGRLLSHQLKPTMAQALRATRLLIALESAVREERRLEERLAESYSLIDRALRLVRQTVPPETWSRVLREVDKDTDLRLFVPPHKEAA